MKMKIKAKMIEDQGGHEGNLCDFFWQNLFLFIKRSDIVSQFFGAEDYEKFRNKCLGLCLRALCKKSFRQGGELFTECERASDEAFLRYNLKW